MVVSKIGLKLILNLYLDKIKFDWI